MITKQKGIKRWLVLGLLLVAGVEPALADDKQPWEAPYTGENATGESVVALWKFAPEDPGLDSSTREHRLKLRGVDTAFAADGIFGGALQIGDEHQPEDSRQGAIADAAADLTPQGPFTLEMWVRPGTGLDGRKFVCLLDNKYLIGTDTRRNGNEGYMLRLRKIGTEPGRFSIEADLGFGDASEVVISDPQALEPDQWQHLAFTYDGQGECAFFLNGKKIGEKTLGGRTAVQTAKRDLVIGDRFGSVGQRFLGKIAEVRISRKVVPLIPREVVLLDASESRSAFYRGEEKAFLRVTVANETSRSLDGAAAEFRAPGYPARRHSLPPLKAGGKVVMEIPVDTEIRAGAYKGTLAILEAEAEKASAALTLTIVPRPLPNQMPVVMWGSVWDLPALVDIGFTHTFALWQASSAAPVEFASPAKVHQARRTIDRLFASRIGSLGQVSVARNASFREQYGRVNRNGKRLATINGLLPEV